MGKAGATKKNNRDTRAYVSLNCMAASTLYLHTRQSVHHDAWQRERKTNRVGMTCA
jgi:hypothetical protein